jgi:hypothetical protein
MSDFSNRKFHTDADTYKAYQFSQIPAKQDERTPYEIRMDSLHDALDECEQVLSGARQAADPRHIPVYEKHKAAILSQIKELKANPDKHGEV